MLSYLYSLNTVDNIKMEKKFSSAEIAFKLRKLSIIMSSAAQAGHPTSALSCADIIAVLFNEILQKNDNFILSKGHAQLVVYAMYNILGEITNQELLKYRTFASNLEGHPTTLFPFTKAATGSLGNGLGIGLGYAYENKSNSYVLLGDSEMTEGSNWEAIEIAGYYQVKNLIAIVDANNLGQQTNTIYQGNPQAFAKQFESFGWQTIIIDGHNLDEIKKALLKKHDKPLAIIAVTEKGYGVPSLQKTNLHGKPVDFANLNNVLQELYAFFDKKYLETELELIVNQPLFTGKKIISTRMAFGQSLVDLGKKHQDLYCLDAEVSNSTYTNLFAENYPERFIQCFVAEQNMVNMAIGLEKTDKKVFLSTFAAFLTRAFDQIRMAAINRSNLKICGSHAGVSIGSDGPSQMGLEDIAMMRTIPNSIVLYPCDSVSTANLTELMIEYNLGLSYLRTTREATPKIYQEGNNFFIGGSNILVDHDDAVALIVTAGLPVHFALEAIAELKKHKLEINLIDAYSIKPIDYQTITKQFNKCQKRLLIIEDHYPEGGLGEAIFPYLKGGNVIHKAVSSLPKSGSCKELLEYYKFDTLGIIETILELINN
jgi:transketolase